MDWTAKITLECIKQYEFETCETGYILDVDSKGPKGLHDEHNEFPLAPEVMCVKANMLSKCQRDLYPTVYEREAQVIVHHLN